MDGLEFDILHDLLTCYTIDYFETTIMDINTTKQSVFKSNVPFRNNLWY